MTLFDRAMRWIDDFTDTIRAGYYTPALPAPPKDEETLPRKPWVMTALGVFSVASALLTNTVIGLAIEASLIGVTAGIGLAGVIGAGILGTLYLKSKKAGAEKIAETNVAGQQVEGPRSALYKLHRAQRQIIGLTESFADAASPKMIQAEVQQIIADTAALRASVKVTDPGDAPGHRTDYEFVRPIVQFADAAAPIETPAAPVAIVASVKKPAPRRKAAPHPQKRQMHG